jgi:hypothetical protein
MSPTTHSPPYSICVLLSIQHWLRCDFPAWWPLNGLFCPLLLWLLRDTFFGLRGQQPPPLPKQKSRQEESCGHLAWGASWFISKWELFTNRELFVFIYLHLSWICVCTSCVLYVCACMSGFVVFKFVCFLICLFPSIWAREIIKITTHTHTHVHRLFLL